MLKGEIRDKAYEDVLDKGETLILSLETALLKTENQNLQIKTQAYQVEEAKASLLLAGSEFLPDLGLASRFGQRDGNFQIFGNQVIRIRQKTINPTATARFGLFEGGRVLFGFIAERNLLTSQKENLLEVEQLQLSNTANTYFEVQRYAGELQSEMVRLEQAEQNFADRKRALELGDEIKLSVVLAEQELEETKARIANLKALFYSQSAKLNEILNLPESTLILPVFGSDEKRLVSWYDQPDFASLYAKATDLRPDLKASRFLSESARFRQYQAFSGFFPTVEVQGQIGYVGARWSDIFPDEQLSLIVRYDLLQNLGGSVLSSYLGARNARLKQNNIYDSGLKLLGSELSKALLGVVSGESAVQATKAALKASEESYRQAVLRLKEGLGTPFELNVAQSNLEKARSGYFSQVLNFKTSQVALLKELGMINVKNLTEGVVL